MVNKVDWQDVKLVRKLNSEAKIIRELQTENHTLKSTIVSVQDSFTDVAKTNEETDTKLQHEENIKLQEDLVLIRKEKSYKICISECGTST